MDQSSFWTLGTAEAAGETAQAAHGFPGIRRNDSVRTVPRVHLGNVGYIVSIAATQPMGGKPLVVSSSVASFPRLVRRRWHLSLRMRLALLVLVSLLPILVFSLVTGYQDYTHAVDRTGREPWHRRVV